MADAVTDVASPDGVQEVAAEDIGSGTPRAVQSWSCKGAKLGEVLDALPELRHKAGGRDSATRTAVMTLVIVTGPDDDVGYALSTARAIGANHPCRLLVLRPDLDSIPVIDAEAHLWRAQAPESPHPVYFEELHMDIGGQAASHLASIAGPFVLADLPVVIWFPSTLPDPTDPLLRLASAVFVDTRWADSSDLAHSYRALLELANHQPVVDLSWVRLQPWRELLAGLFEPEQTRCMLTGVRQATVLGNTSPRHMLGGWLMSQLDLRAREVSLADAKHVAITVEASHGDEDGQFEVTRYGDSRAVWAKATLSGGMSISQALPLPDDSLTTALAAALSNLRADRVWERALAAAAALAS